MRVERRERTEEVVGTLLWGDGLCFNLEPAALFSFWDRTPWRPPQGVWGAQEGGCRLKGSGLYDL